jgi:hypothetical protein
VGILAYLPYKIQDLFKRIPIATVRTLIRQPRVGILAYLPYLTRFKIF